MPVVKDKKNRILVCDVCGAESKSVKPRSPAAPDLDACEQMEKEGWHYSLGFFSMLMGHQVWCPDCAAGGAK